MNKLIIASLTSLALTGTALAQTTAPATDTAPAGQTETAPAGATDTAPAGDAMDTDTDATTTAPAAPATGAMGTDASGAAAMGADEQGFYTYQEGRQMLGSGLMGADVWGADGESIGSVDDLLIDEQGQILAVVVGVGGFLGLGTHSVAISTDELNFVLAEDAAAQDGAATTTTDTMAPATGTTDTMAPAAGTTATDTTTAPAATDPATAPMDGAAAEGDDWGWSGAGIERIEVSYTREQLENAPEFESAE